MTDGCLEFGRVSIVWNGNDDLDIVGRRSSFELRLGFDHEFDPGMGVSFNHTLDPDQRLYLKNKIIMFFCKNLN
jgi:hypothetical protein